MLGALPHESQPLNIVFSYIWPDLKLVTYPLQLFLAVDVLANDTFIILPLRSETVDLSHSCCQRSTDDGFFFFFFMPEYLQIEPATSVCQYQDVEATLTYHPCYRLWSAMP